MVDFNYMRPCYVSYNNDDMLMLYNYLLSKYSFEIISCGLETDTNMSFIDICDMDEYENIIKDGNKFLISNNIKDVLYVDICGNLLNPNLIYLGLLNLDKRKGSIFWALDERLPKDVKNYLSCLKKHIDPKGTIIQRYEEDKCGGYLVLMSKDINKYEEYQYKMQEFFVENGFGPFDSFEILNEVGAIVDDTKYLSKTLKKGGNNLWT